MRSPVFDDDAKAAWTQVEDNEQLEVEVDAADVSRFLLVDIALLVPVWLCIITLGILTVGRVAKVVAWAFTSVGGAL